MDIVLHVELKLASGGLKQGLQLPDVSTARPLKRFMKDKNMDNS